MMRFLTLLATVMSSLTLIANQRPFNFRFFLFFIPKLFAGGLTPVWAMIGTAGAFTHLRRRRPFYLLATLLATLLSLRHIRRVTRSQDEAFDRAFGQGWQARIPNHRQRHMLSRRYRPLVSSPRSGFRWRRNIPFWNSPATDRSLLCDIWQPAPEIAPTGLGIIYLHGSAWHYMDKDLGTRPFFRRLARQGHVIMDVAYTLAPEGDIYCIVCDVKRAISWMKNNASQLGVNPERIVLMGGSAGGHLSLLAGFTPNHPTLEPDDISGETSIHAIVCYYGVADMVEMYRYVQPESSPAGQRAWEAANGLMNRLEPFLKRLRFVPAFSHWEDPKGWFANLFHGTPEERFDAYQLVSPVSHVSEHSPPTLLIQGSHDLGGLVNQTRRLHRELCRHGATSIYLELPDTEHAFDVIFPQISPAAQVATYYVERFLALVA